MDPKNKTNNKANDKDEVKEGSPTKPVETTSPKQEPKPEKKSDPVAKEKPTDTKEAPVSSFSQIEDDKKKEEGKLKTAAPQTESPAAKSTSPNQTSESEAKEWIKKDKDTVSENPKKKPDKKALVGGGVALIVIGILTGGVFYFNSRVSNTQPLQKESSAEVTTPEPTPSPSPESKVDLSILKVSVLNGSGTAGQAGVVQGLLENIGFKDIETDNAGSFDFTSTEVSVKEGLSSTIYKAAEDALKDDYVVKESDKLPENSAFDVIIIIGSSTPEG